MNFTKKVLLCSSFVVALGSIKSYAEAPSLKISGFTAINATMGSQKQKTQGKGGADPHIAIGASDLKFTVAGSSEKGFKYKYVINFEAISKVDPYINRNYIEFSDNSFGTIQFGTLKGPEHSMLMSAVDIIGGSGGIDGAFPATYSNSEGVIEGVNLIGEAKTATKIVWYSPEVMGLQVGIGFTPNTSHMGKKAKQNDRMGALQGAGNQDAIYPDKDISPFATRNISIGVSYKNAWDKWSLHLAGVMIHENAKLVLKNSYKKYSLHKTTAYQLSAAIGYDQFMIAAGWIDNGKSRLPTAETMQALRNIDTEIDKTDDSKSKYGAYYKWANIDQGNAGKAWNIGASYTFGAYQLAASYHRTDRKTDATNKASSDVITTTLDFAALQGLKFYGEVNFVRSRTNQKMVDGVQAYNDTKANGNASTKATGNNSATIFVVGSKVSF